MDQKLPSEKLADRPRRVRTAVIAVAAAVVVVAGGLGGGLAFANSQPKPAVTATADPYVAVERPVSPNSVEGSAAVDKAQADAAAAAAAQAAAEAQAAADAAAKEQQGQPKGSAGSDRLPSGATPPNVPGTDSPDSTACESSSVTNDGNGGFVCL